MLVRVYTCQNVKLLEMSCRGSFFFTSVYKSGHRREVISSGSPWRHRIFLQNREGDHDLHT